MRFTLSWLKSFIKTDAEADAIAISLDKIGLEVESIRDMGQGYEGFVVAEIISTAAHPDADKLAVCQVYDGTASRQVVCGAPNARAGIKVVLATVGAIVPNGEFAIKLSKIRGIESCGMLCSATELLLGEESDGIIELDSAAIPGTKFSQYALLDDVVFEIAITPNRGDCASVLGVARDLAAFGVGDLINHEELQLQQPAQKQINVSIEDDVCREFYGTYVAGINHGEIPRDINAKLRAVDSKKKLALVDISNFMMMSYGRPNHIYDADKIDGNVVVRRALAGEIFMAIGGAEYLLNDEITVVADQSKVLAVAGIIGGELSKVTEDTKNIFVEVANFDPIAVAKAGRFLNIHSDARFRFERRIDHGNSDQFNSYILAMIQSCCAGLLGQTVKVRRALPAMVQSIEFDWNKVNIMLGTSLTAETCISTLTKLGFKCEGGVVHIPTYRQGEVSIVEDLVEEIIRIQGYENIPSLMLPQGNECKPIIIKPSTAAAQVLMNRGMQESISWAFFSKNDADVFGDSELKLKNPISTELQVMRSSIVPNLLRFVAYHANRGRKGINFFEWGAIYGKNHPGKQINCLAGVRSGSIISASAHQEVRASDFFDIKADLFAALGAFSFNVDALQLSRNCPEYYHPGQSASFTLGKTVIAYCGALHPKVLAAYDLEAPVFIFEIFADSVPVGKYKPKAKYSLNALQPVMRDFAFIMKQELPAVELLQVIKKANVHISGTEIFDVYQGKGVADGMKSIAVSVSLQPQKVAFIDSEIEEIAKDIVNAVQAKLGASLRS